MYGAGVCSGIGAALMARRAPYWRAMRRARRSWRNREDADPLLIIGPEESADPIITGMVARWAWLHRSAFLPFIIAPPAPLEASA